MIKECDSDGLKYNGFIPNFPYLQVPGHPLRMTFECDDVPTDLALSTDQSRCLMTKKKDSQFIQKFDLITSEKLPDICTSVGEMKITPDGKRLLIMDHITEKAIKIHCSESGQYLGQLIPMNQIQMKAKEKYKMGKLSISNTNVCFTVTTEKSYLCIANLEACRFLEVKGLEGRCCLCQMTPDSRYIFYNVNDKLYSYDMGSLEVVSETALEYTPTQMAFTDMGTRGFMINPNENKVYVFHLNEGYVQMVYKVVLSEHFEEDRMVNLQLSHNQEMLLVQGLNNLVVYNVGTEKVMCHFPRPSDVPKEFKLPRTHTVDLHFTKAAFTHDNKFLIGTIFRQIYVWNVITGRLLTNLQAPVGIIRDLLIPSDRGQIITHQDRFNTIQVWGLGDAIGHVGTLDRQTASVKEVIFTKDDKMAFVGCSESDEIGVLDMKTGQMIDLFTHDSPVAKFSITPDGNHLFVATSPKMPNEANKIWHLNTRKIIYEFGNGPAHNIPLQNENAIVAIHQADNKFKTPYNVSLFKFNENEFNEIRLQQDVKFVLSEPFLTPEDKYLVILTADSYNDQKAQYDNPTICAISLKASMSMNSFSASDLRHIVRMRRILHIRPYNNSYTVIALYTNETDLIDGEKRKKGYDHCYGFMIFDVCSGVVCQVIDSFMAPSTPMDQVLFTRDVSHCIDNQSNVFDMANGYYVKNLQPEKEHIPPRCLALGGLVVLYFHGSMLYALRVADGKQVGVVDVHGTITCLGVCHDDRTIVAGCEDGSLVSYAIIDSLLENKNKILPNILSRQRDAEEESGRKSSRSWDKVETSSTPSYSRPPSALSLGPSDRELLKSVRPVPRVRPTSDTLLYLNTKSKTCVVM